MLIIRFRPEILPYETSSIAPNNGTAAMQLFMVCDVPPVVDSNGNVTTSGGYYFRFQYTYGSGAFQSTNPWAAPGIYGMISGATSATEVQNVLTCYYL